MYIASNLLGKSKLVALLHVYIVTAGLICGYGRQRYVRMSVHVCEDVVIHPAVIQKREKHVFIE